jgi:hypothetical protein
VQVSLSIGVTQSEGGYYVGTGHSQGSTTASFLRSVTLSSAFFTEPPLLWQMHVDSPDIGKSKVTVDPHTTFSIVTTPRH